MTPVGHACVGYLLATRSPRVCVPAMVIGALWPDIDYGLLWSPAFEELHRTATHSLLFLALTGAVASLAGPVGRRPAIALSFVAGGLSHLLIDSCLDANPSNGLGVAFLWPIVREPISLVNFLGPGAGFSGWSEPRSMLADAWRMLLLETPLAIAALFVWLRRRSANNEHCAGPFNRHRSR